MLVGWCVDYEAGGVEKCLFEGAGHGEEEEHLCGGWYIGETGDSADFGWREGVVREREGGGQCLQFGVVLDVFGDAVIIATWEELA